MSDNYEQERRKQREANRKKLIRLIPSFIFLLTFVVLVILSRHKQYDASKVIGDSSSSQQTAEGDQSGQESQESSQKTRNTAINEVLDIPETGDAQPFDELTGDKTTAAEGDGNICVSLVAWNAETFTITIRIDNNTDADITCSGQPLQVINGVSTTMSAFKNSSTSMKAIPAGTYQCVTYLVSEECFAETTETLVFDGNLRWKEGHGTETFKYNLEITFNAGEEEAAE